MTGYGVVGPTSQSHLDWCRQMWEGVRDGGIWGVPRSGLVFQKDEQARRLTLTERMPHMPGMPGTAEEWAAYQDEDAEAIRLRFVSIGIEVVI